MRPYACETHPRPRVRCLVYGCRSGTGPGPMMAFVRSRWLPGSAECLTTVRGATVLRGRAPGADWPR